MKHCRNCGVQKKDNAKLCIGCGQNDFSQVSQQYQQSPKIIKKPGKIILLAMGIVIGLAILASCFNDSPSQANTIASTTKSEKTVDETKKSTSTKLTTTESTTFEQTTTESVKETTETPPLAITAPTTTQQVTTTTTAPTTTQQVITTSTTAAPTTTQTTTTQPSVELKFLSVTSPITIGNEATLEFSGEPNTKYKIAVYYSSGASKAAGLEDKTSNSNGFVSWTWKVGTNTNPGKYRIVVSGNGNSVETKFTVE